MKIEIDLDIPEALLDERLRSDLTLACREEAVLRLFAEERISAPAAAQLLGLTRIQFMELAKRRGVPHIVYTAEDFREDMRDLELFERAAGPAE
jgi:predicted HTH domain antitoxin